MSKFRAVISKDEVDLNNPIFVCYVNVINENHQKANEIMKMTSESFSIYKNITVWVMGSDQNKIECVYDGLLKSRDIELKDLIENINQRIDILSNSSNFDEFKIQIRDWRINNLITDELGEK